MSDVGSASQDPPGNPVRQRPRSLIAIVPSWLASLVLHGTLLFVFASGLKSCSDGSAGVAEGEFREIGIYVKQPQSSVDEHTIPNEPIKQPTSASFSSETPLPSEVEDQPPVELLTPALDNFPVIGIGPVAPPEAPSELSDTARPNAILTPSQAAGLGPGVAEFFDIRDKGTRFVYVMDNSGSMSDHNAIGVAKAELMASLQGLDANQQFQIIFYNETPNIMSLRGRKENELYWATSINRTLARDYIRSIHPTLGTVHLDALEAAMKLDVDVIFFLTDAQSQLRAAELHRIKKRNNGRARIHCIEFGNGNDLSLDNFLKKLARQNGGSYQYRDVTRFGG